MLVVLDIDRQDVRRINAILLDQRADRAYWNVILKDVIIWAAMMFGDFRGKRRVPGEAADVRDLKKWHRAIEVRRREGQVRIRGSMLHKQRMVARNWLEVHSPPAAQIKKVGVTLNERVIRSYIHISALLTMEHAVKQNVFHVLGVGEPGNIVDP